ncbi:MAG: succinate--CoA ligase subunit alpha [Betaproteobacteria bacterium]|nr:succinate--CoA ligase subunit alpha [Betaproteobacteria bacterium]
MSILIDAGTRVLVQGITGNQARFDTEWCLRYGTRIVAGVTPGRGGEEVHRIPVYDTVARAVAQRPADACIVYAPAPMVRPAVLEALDACLQLVVITAEFVPLHDVVHIVAAARSAGATLVGCNTNGVISPGKSKVGGVGGIDPASLYDPGRIGVCSRSGGMTVEISLALRAGGYGISTSVAMGGDRVTGMTMGECLLRFEKDAETDAMVIFGEPGTANEQEVAALLRAGRITKPVVALISGAFQETHPRGMSFGHAAAMIGSDDESASAKRAALAAAGAHIAAALEDIPVLLRRALVC